MTTMVCGAPLSFGAAPSSFGSSTNASRKSGRFSSVRGFAHEVVSLMTLASNPTVQKLASP